VKHSAVYPCRVFFAALTWFLCPRLATGIGPIAVVVDGLSAASEYMPAALAALGLLAMAFAIFKYRASVAKSLLVVVRKITRSKGR
jgi:hypothetical protein